jgi:hypothetical protein
MRHSMILAASATLFAALAAPAAAGVGQCVWEHIPAGERGQAITPAGMPTDTGTSTDSAHFAEAFFAAVDDATVEAAISACGVPANQHDAAWTALGNYAHRIWAEQRLFRYPPHIWTRQLESAWNALDAGVKLSIAHDATDPSKLAADLDTAQGAFMASLQLVSLVSDDEGVALRAYIQARASGE